MRPIDAVSLSEGIELHRQSTDQKCEMDRQWAVGYNAGLDRALYSIAYAKTIAPPPNDPLTPEELREMDGEPVWVESFVVGLNSRWGIVHGNYISDGKLPSEKGKCLLLINDTGGYDIAWLAYRRKP